MGADTTRADDDVGLHSKRQSDKGGGHDLTLFAQLQVSTGWKLIDGSSQRCSHSIPQVAPADASHCNWPNPKSIVETPTPTNFRISSVVSGFLTQEAPSK